VPAVQEPDWVQRSPSSHAVPFGASRLEHTPVAGLQVPATWQPSSAVHTTGLAPVQTPAWQVSLRLQALPSSQGLPFGLGGSRHRPVNGSHAPDTWHWSLAVHTTVLVPTHAPSWQWSPCVHRLPSTHAIPFVAGGLEHTPVAGLHAPATWH